MAFKNWGLDFVLQKLKTGVIFRKNIISFNVRTFQTELLVSEVLYVWDSDSYTPALASASARSFPSPENLESFPKGRRCMINVFQIPCMIF